MDTAIDDKETFLYSVFHSARGAITATVKTFKDKQKRMRAMTSLMLMPGIEHSAEMEEILAAKLGLKMEKGA